MFKNYLVGLEKYNPNYFLYENNKSMAPAIREQITKELEVEPILINSSLVSAQNRQRLYWTNIPNVTQPEDKGILLRDVLETGIVWTEKSYALTTRCQGAIPEDTLKRHRHTMIAEPVSVLNINPSGRGMNGAVMRVDGKSRTLTTNKGEGPKIIEPVRIGTIENDAKNNDFDSQQYRVYAPDGKAVTLCGNGGGVGAKTGLYAVPINTTSEGKAQCLRATYYKDGIRNLVGNTVDRKTCIAESVPFDEANYELINGAEIFISNGKIRQGDSLGSKQGKYVYTELTEKSNVISAGQAHNEKVLVPAPKGEWKTIYMVRDGQITIKGKQCPIKLPDGYYIIRKLTVTECKRLQTVPDTYIFPVSNTHAYKMLGNGWTVDVISHILSFVPDIKIAPIEVMSMYDGMSCGHIALDKLGANVERYYATEIDKYAVQTTLANYPDTIQLGDAFQVLDDGWKLPTYSVCTEQTRQYID